MLEFDIYQAALAFVLATTFTLLSLGIGFSKLKNVLIASGEMEPGQSWFLMPLILLAVILGAILVNPVVAIVTVGMTSAIIALTTLVRLLESY